MKYENLLTERADGIMTVTLNRPRRLNAVDGALLDELLAVVDEIDGDDDVRVAVFTGAGRAFCAGADLGAGEGTFDRGAQSSIDLHRDGGGRLALRLYQCTRPLIAAVNGPAVGVGVTMTLPMDVRIASADARFGFVFARRGLVPEACSTWFLPRVVGIGQAMEWVATGRIFPAAEAHQRGLVSRIVAPQALLSTAHALGREIADNTSAVSVALTRQMMWRALGYEHPMQAHRVESKGIFAMGQSADAREGVSSFLDKRPADFRMRVTTDMPEFYPWWQEPPFEP